MTKIEPLEARIAPATLVVSNNLDSGPGSFRQAILDANALGGLDSIILGVPSFLPIRPTTPLPAITDSVNIEYGFEGNQRILLDGSSIGEGGSGLTLSGPNSGGSKISGLAIFGFGNAGIEIINSSNNLITGNYLGINPTGIAGSQRMSDGILVNGGADNQISSNTIGGNEVGIRVTGDAIATKIWSNEIGIWRLGGVLSVPNKTGILVENANRTVIEKWNTVAANVNFGVRLMPDAVETEIYQNYIGVMAQSFGPISSQEWGIYIDGARGTVVGAGEFASSFNRGNVISKNTTGGVWIRLAGNSQTTRIEGNILGGMDLSFNGSRTGNGGAGIFVNPPEQAHESAGLSISSNLISDNMGAGIEISGVGGYVIAAITGNLIGADRSGTEPLGNGVGIIVDTSGSIDIGRPGTLGNTIVANKGDGIVIKNGSTTIVGNYIGYAPQTDGAPKMGNAGHGVHLIDAGYVNVGTSLGQALGNIITSNGGDGIRIAGSSPSGGRIANPYLRIAGNFIGTDGVTAKGNLGAGIHVLDLMRDSDIKIGNDGPAPNLSRTSARNVVSGNQGDGILVERSDEVSIVGNYVGTDFRGLNPLGNGGDGIALVDSNICIVQGGVVAANLGHGIRIFSSTQNPGGYTSSNINMVLNVNVGLGADNNMRMSNALSAVVLENAYGSRIGGNAAGNRIYSQNVALELDGANQTRVFDNEFRSISGAAVVFDHGTRGTEFGGYSDDGSKVGNVVISEADTALLISDGASNSITNNRFEAPNAGISILTGIDNTIYENRFTIASGGLFIDLGGNGVTPNDPLDADAGPNNLLNSPLLVSAAIRDGKTFLRGEYRGAADTQIAVSWYVNGEFLAESIAQTDATGMAKLALDINEEFEVGAEFMASGISFGSDSRDTSEFSNAVFAMEAPEVVAKGAATGQKPRAQLVDAVTGEVILEQVPFGKGYRGGVGVATGDVDGDGIADLIATQRKGNGVVKIYSGLDGHLINSFWLGAAKASAIRSLAVGDLDGDGTMEIVTGLAHTKGGRVLVHDALTGVFEADFAPFGAKTPSRLSVGLSDADGDNHPEIVVLSGSKRAVLDPMSGQIEQLAHVVRG